MFSYAQGCKPQLSLGSVINFCQGNSLTLNAYNPNTTYTWSNGATTPTITVTTSGIYWVIATNNCGSSVDSVEVIADPRLNVNLGADRNFCSTSADTLFAPYGANYNYQWSTGSTSYFLPVTQSGTYWVRVTNACSTYRDTVTLTAETPPNLNLGNDINTCNNNPVTLNTPSGGSNLWSTGDTASQITVTQTGTYWLASTNSCGTFYDSVQVNFLNNINLNLPDTAYLCPGGQITLTALGGNGSYTWSNGSTTSSIQVSTAGYISVQFTNQCGTFTDSTYVQLNANPTVDLGNDTIICASTNFILNAGNKGSSYIWNTGATSRTITVDSTGLYYVDVNNGCSTLTDSIYIEVYDVPYPDIAAENRICPGTPLYFNARNWGPNTTFLWSTGATSQVESIDSSGSYWVTVSNICGSTTVNFDVYDDAPADFSLGADDTIICQQSFMLKPDIFVGNGDTLLWSDGSTKDSLIVQSSGLYWLQITNACGTYTDSIQLTLQKGPRNIKADTLDLCSGSTRTISIPLVDNTRYLWSTGDTTNSIVISTPGTYTVSASNYCDTIQDQVVVREVFPVNIDLGADTSFCEPNVLVLDASNYNADSLIWSTGSKNNVLPITSSGTYSLTVFNACGAFTDTINVTVFPLPKNVLSNQAVCSGQTATFDATQTIPVNYSWNTGSTNPSITVNTEGWYTVTMTNSCGTVTDSAFLRVDSVIPPINLGNDTIFCDGTLTLDAGSYGGAAYLWQNGSTQKTFTVSKSGLYYVRVSNACNTVYDSINVLITGPPALTLGNVVRFCFGNTLTLNAQNPGSTYLWNNGDTSQTLDVTTAGTYWVTITNDCGILTDTVEAVVEYPMFDLDLGNDTLICAGQTLTLNTNYPGVTTLWNDGSSLQTLNVTTTGAYSVKVSNTCGTWYDSIYVEVQDVPTFSLGVDTVICAENGELTLSGPTGLKSYLWNTGDTTQTLTVYQAGVFYLEVENQCFSYTDTIVARPEYPITFDLGEDTVLCEGETIALNTGITNYPITWNNGNIGSSLLITQSGTYIASAQNSCGFFSDTISVQFDAVPDNLTHDTTICAGDSLLFSINADYTVFWADGDTAHQKNFGSAGDYNYTLSNACGDFEATLSVDSSNCQCPFFTANAFSPNGDGKNDAFIVKHSCDLTYFNMQIYNRWGAKIFESDNAQNGWTGQIAGEAAPEGVYIYHLYYKWNVYNSSRFREESGQVFLIR